MKWSWRFPERTDEPTSPCGDVFPVQGEDGLVDPGDRKLHTSQANHAPVLLDRIQKISQELSTENRFARPGS
jgi:hypothetical protein